MRPPLILACAALAQASAHAAAAALDAHRYAGSKPNVIILFADDYGTM